MRILFYLHRLTIGGIQVNAIDMATAIRGLGHDVVVASPPGPLASVVEERGLTFVPTPIRGHFRPSPTAIRAVASLVHRDGFDLVHAHSAFASLEAFYGAHVRHRLPLVASFMGMSYPRYLPTTIPLIVGTRDVLAAAEAARSGRVLLMEPPIDTVANDPSVDGVVFRRANGIDDGDLAIVIVSRLAIHMKLDSLIDAIEATALLAEEFPVRLVVVGDGKALPLLRERADTVNKRSGRDVVTFVGHLVDPRPAYAAADVVVGMGSSILRGMAFGKPAMVLGERGFSKVVTAETMSWFMLHGFYGVGDGSGSVDRSATQLRGLLQNRELMNDLGRFARELVCKRFSLDASARSLVALYEEVSTDRVSSRTVLADAVATAGHVLAHKANRMRKMIVPPRPSGPSNGGAMALIQAGDDG